MFYDHPPAKLGYPEGYTLEAYQTVFDSFESRIARTKIVMGFEPGDQPAGGFWEGLQVDEEVIAYIEEQKYGGAMFWAMNHRGGDPGRETELAEQVLDLARHCMEVFPSASTAEGEEEEGPAKFISGSYEIHNDPIANPPLANSSPSDPWHYAYDIAAMTHVFYSFLTLAADTSPLDFVPPQEHWDGEAIYESFFT